MPRLRRQKKKDPSSNDEDLHQWCKDLLEDGEARRRPWEAQWWDNIATYGGDLWAEFDVHKNQLTSSKPADHKVRLPINLSQPVLRTEYAKLMKNRPILNVLARSNDKTDMNAADVGDKMINDYAEREFHLPRVRRRAAWWTLVTGLGGIFMDYDESLLGEKEVLVDPAGNPVFDERMVSAIQRHYRDKKKRPKTKKIPVGDAVPTAISPFQLVWDMSKLLLDDAWWCIVTDVYDVDEIWRRWEVDVEAEDDALPGIMERRALANADLSGKLTLKNVKAQRMAKVHRMFVRPGHRYFPDGAEIVFTKEELLDSTTFPFSDNQLPVSVMGHVPFYVGQYGLSVIQAIKPAVLELSKTESQLVENRNIMGNPPWIIYKQNQIEGEIQNKPGMRVEIWHQPNVPEPHPVEMPEIAQYIQNLIPTLREHILEISGQGETSQGRVPAGARSGVAIAYLQEEDDTKLGPTVQEFEEMIERSHGQLLNRFAQFYDAPRTVRIYKPNSEPEVFDFVGTMLDGTAGIICQAGSALPRSKAAKQQFILDLFDRGLEQDPRRIREMLELAQGEPDDWELDMQQAERENRRLQQGEQVQVIEWQNHAAHHRIHRNFMKSQDFEALEPAVQQTLVNHDEEHSRFERAQQQAQMVQAAMGGGTQNGNGSGRPNLANGMNNQEAPPQFQSPNGMGSVINAEPA